MQCTNNVEIVRLKQTELASMNYVEISYLHSNFHTLPSTKEFRKNQHPYSHRQEMS